MNYALEQLKRLNIYTCTKLATAQHPSYVNFQFMILEELKLLIIQIDRICKIGFKGSFDRCGDMAMGNALSNAIKSSACLVQTFDIDSAASRQGSEISDGLNFTTLLLMIHS